MAFLVNLFFLSIKPSYICLVNFISSTLLNPSRMAKRPQTHHSRWTPEQDTQLKNMVAGGFSSAEIANFFGRTLTSIYSRKLILGLKGRIKRSTKSQVEGSIKKFDTKPARKPKLVKVAEKPKVQIPEPPVATLFPIAPSTPKRGRKPKEKSKMNGYNKYTFKLAFVNQRLQRGDIKSISDICKKSPGFVSRVIDGWYLSEEVLDMAFLHMENRPTNTMVLQGLGLNRK